MGYIGSSCSVMVVGGFERDGGIGLDLKNNEAVVGFNLKINEVVVQTR